jgi:hypothetical protein
MNGTGSPANNGFGVSEAAGVSVRAGVSVAGRVAVKAGVSEEAVVGEGNCISGSGLGVGAAGVENSPHASAVTNKTNKRAYLRK